MRLRRVINLALVLAVMAFCLFGLYHTRDNRCVGDTQPSHCAD